MSQTARLRVVIVFAIVAALVSIAVAGLAFRRATELQSLRLETDATLQGVYRLSNTTYSMLYAASDFQDAYAFWQTQFDRAFESLDALAFHPGLSLLDDQVGQRVRQTRNLWGVSTNGFVSGARLLDEILGALPEEVDRSNLADIVSQLEELRTPDGGGELPQSLLFDVRRAFLEIDATNEGFGFFTTSALTGLGSDIQNAAQQAIRTTIIVASIVAVGLILLVLGALVFGVRLLQSANANLEVRVQERTRSIQSLLDFSGEGFLSFGSDLIIRPEISRECETIFGRSVVGLNVSRVLFDDPEKQEDFSSAMEIVFSGRSDPEVVFDVLDSRISIGGKTIEVSLNMVDEDSVMCALRDITENEQLRAQNEEQQRKREMVLRIVTARSQFTGILDEGDELFSRLDAHLVSGEFTARDDEYDSLTRELHTFKSNAGFLKMRNSSELAHELETALIDAHIMGDTEPVTPLIDSFRGAYREEIQFVKQAVGEQWVQNRSMQEVDGDSLQDIYHHVLAEHGHDTELVQKLDAISRLPLSSLFARMEEHAVMLSSSRGKYVQVTWDDQDASVHTRVYQAVSDALNHLVRNMVDHGIEFPPHREQAGKPHAGTIDFSVERENGRLKIRVSDDGRGIDVDQVHDRARQLGIVGTTEKLTPQDLVRTVFSDGFSTAAATTATSGRGEGLPAVRQRIRELGGTIHLSTRRGRGTQFTLTIPDPGIEVPEQP